MTTEQQLELLAPPKPRKRRSPKEIELHCQLADLLLKFAKNPAWRYTHLPMGEHRTKETALKLQRMGVTPGWPDFMFVGPSCVFWLELKRAKTGRLNDAQLQMRAHLIRCRFNYLVTARLEDAVTTLQDFGILPRGIRLQ